MSLTERHSESLPGVRIRVWSVTAAVLFAVAAAACSDDGEALSDAATTTGPTTTTTTEPEQTVEDEVVERYLAFWDARFQANTEPANPDHPGLREYAAEEQLAQVVLETTQRRDQGFALRAADEPVTEHHRVKVASVDDETATLQDCATDDDVIYRISTGEIVNERVATRNVEATMRRIDGVWKLVHTRVVQTWEGVAGCAQSPDF